MKKLFSLLLVFTLFGCASIKNEYSGIEGDTSVKQISEQDVVELFETGTGVLLFSFPDSEWCQEMMPLLNDEALELEVEVFYFNVASIREDNTDNYQLMYEEILDYVKFTEYDPLLYDQIYVPTLVKIENGHIVDFHLGTTTDHVMTSDGLPALTAAQKFELRAVINRFLN